MTTLNHSDSDTRYTHNVLSVTLSIYIKRLTNRSINNRLFHSADTRFPLVPCLPCSPSQKNKCQTFFLVRFRSDLLRAAITLLPLLQAVNCNRRYVLFLKLYYCYKKSYPWCSCLSRYLQQCMRITNLQILFHRWRRSNIVPLTLYNLHDANFLPVKLAATAHLFWRIAFIRNSDYRYKLLYYVSTYYL